jgi:Aspartyl protease
MNLIGLFYIKKGLLYLMLLLSYSAAKAEKGGRIFNSNNLPPAAFTESKFDADSSTGIIPFSRAGNLIVVKAKVDTMEGNFILDTGSPHLVLNLTYFRDYPSTWSQSEEKKGITGSVENVLQTTVASFSFGDLKQYRVNADLVNLGHIENRKGIRILGLIGMELLDRYEMIIDYEKNLIYLHLLSKKKSSSYQHEMLNDTAAYYTSSLELNDGRVIVKTEIAGKKMRLIIDSGAETNILDSRLPDNVFDEVTISSRILLTGIGNKKVEALRGNLSRLTIGGQRVENLPVLITNLKKTCFSYGGCVDGVLGFDFLSLKKIGFNFVKRKMYIWK